MKKSKRYSYSFFDIFNHAFMILAASVCIYPFINMLAIALNDGLDSLRGGIYLIPRKPTIANFATILSDARILQSIKISVLRTALGIIGAVILNSMMAYALCKKSLPGRKFFNWFIIIPMYFSGGIIPYFLVCRALGLTNRFMVFVLPWLIVPYYILLMRTFIQDMPASIEESAKIDGASPYVVFFRIVLPLTMPSLATIALFAGLMHWNDWFDGMVMVRTKSLWPMQTLLLNILSGSEAANYFKSKNLGLAMGAKQTITPESVKAAIIIVTVAPIVMLYPFLQKYIVKGIMIGGVKG